MMILIELQLLVNQSVILSAAKNLWDALCLSLPTAGRHDSTELNVEYKLINYHFPFLIEVSP